MDDTPPDTLLSRRLVFLGLNCVGKSAIITRGLDQRRFPQGYVPSFNEEHSTTFRHRNRDYRLELVDTQGVTSAPGIFRREYCLGVHGYILVFDATNRKSFDALKAIDEALNDMCADGIARLVVANCIDKKERIVRRKEAEQFAKSINSRYLECSAKSGRNVQRLFHTILDEIDRRQYSDDEACSKWWILQNYCFNIIADWFCSDSINYCCEGPCTKQGVLSSLFLSIAHAVVQISAALFLAINLHDPKEWKFCSIVGGLGLLYLISSICALHGISENIRTFVLFYVLASGVIILLELIIIPLLVYDIDSLREHVFLSLIFFSLSTIVQFTCLLIVGWFIFSFGFMDDFMYTRFSHV